MGSRMETRPRYATPIPLARCSKALIRDKGRLGGTVVDKEKAFAQQRGDHTAQVTPRVYRELTPPDLESLFFFNSPCAGPAADPAPALTTRGSYTPRFIRATKETLAKRGELSRGLAQGVSDAASANKAFVPRYLCQYVFCNSAV